MRGGTRTHDRVIRLEDDGHSLTGRIVDAGGYRKTGCAEDLPRGRRGAVIDGHEVAAGLHGELIKCQANNAAWWCINRSLAEEVV